MCARGGAAGRKQTAVMGTAANMNYAAVVDRSRRRRRGDGGRHRRRRGQCDLRGRSGELARDGGRLREGAGLRRDDQHDAADQPSADAGGAGAGGRHDDRGQERRAAAAGGAEPPVASIWRPAPAPISTASAAPLDAPRALTSTSPHMKLGELIGRATRTATQEALRWQNGLEASYTRGVFHALGRYGVKEATLLRRHRAATSSAADLELLRKNSKAALYEPLVGAAAHALAAVLDRVRHGTIPAAVAARGDRAAGGDAGGEPRGAARSLDRVPRRPLRPATRRRRRSEVARARAAVALGWSEKWRAGVARQLARAAVRRMPSAAGVGGGARSGRRRSRLSRGIRCG